MKTIKAIHEGIDIVCKDENNSFKLMCYGYDESVDEIKVRTLIKESELKRGWIGDLQYSTYKSLNPLNGKEFEEKAKEKYKDVLLTNVKIWSMDDNVIIWEYTFLKK